MPIDEKSIKLTIKSDDVKGRSACYESIVKAKPIELVSLPESFNVLVKELQSLGLRVDLQKGDDLLELERDTGEDMLRKEADAEELMNESEDVNQGVEDSEVSAAGMHDVEDEVGVSDTE